MGHGPEKEDIPAERTRAGPDNGIIESNDSLFAKAEPGNQADDERDGNVAGNVDEGERDAPTTTTRHGAAIAEKAVYLPVSTRSVKIPTARTP